MTGNYIKNIIKKKYKKIRRRLTKAKKEFNEDAIHDVRVEYKKLRAFLRMLSSKSGEEKSLAVSYGLKNCYTIAGKIRDLQLHQKFILDTSKNEAQNPSGYIDLLQKHIDKSKKKFRKASFPGKTRNGIGHFPLSVPASFDVNDFKKYRLQMSASLSSIINKQKRNDDDMHEVRKLLKDFFYNLKEFKKAHGEHPELEGVCGFNEAGSKDLLEEFGQYQDSATGIDFLQSGWIEKLKPSAQELLSKILELLVKRHEDTKQSLEEKLAKLSQVITWQ